MAWTGTAPVFKREPIRQLFSNPGRCTSDIFSDRGAQSLGHREMGIPRKGGLPDIRRGVFVVRSHLPSLTRSTVVAVPRHVLRYKIQQRFMTVKLSKLGQVYSITDLISDKRWYGHVYVLFWYFLGNLRDTWSHTLKTRSWYLLFRVSQKAPPSLLYEGAPSRWKFVT